MKRNRGSGQHTVRAARSRLTHIIYLVGAPPRQPVPSVYSTHVGHADILTRKTTCVRGSYGTVTVPSQYPPYRDDPEDET